MQRAEKLLAELNALFAFRPEPLPPRAAIVPGTVVEVEDESIGRTFFLAPAGGGLERSGPGGDRLLSVVTPASLVGRAGLGRRLGDTVEVTVQGKPREWTITYAA